MAQQVINVGAAANDGTGDSWRDALIKVNANETELFGLTASGSRVVVSSISDLPAAAAGVITLLDNTQYFFVEDVGLGADRLVLGEACAVTGMESIIITLSYTGTGDMITMVDNTCRVNNIALDAPNGRVFNWSETTGKIFRCNDVTIVACNKTGLFSGTTGVIRFTNVSHGSIVADGLEFTGNFRSFLFETSATTIAAGALFNLGTATFDSFIADTILATLNGTSNLISGASGSANINTGGSGLIERMRLSGVGTPLIGITVDDALWEFVGNDDIADTRPDGLLSMQSNATATVIAAAGTPVLVAGTWIVERSSQFTGTTAGRLTYDGGKDATLPITGSFTVEPVSGGAVDISVEVAIDGVIVPNSRRTGNASAGNPTSITIPWQEVFSPATFVEYFVANENSTVNILVSSGTGRVN
jgi:hypothetical protein